ncbi:MAG: hypothetical protein JEZ10_06725 [Verrucomicrobia bacterium]|nr:hypothetical protein [Verrucomicrobiota bacterium]
MSLLLCAAGFLRAAVTPHIGYVYPAGSLPGTTLTVTVGGQFLKDFVGLYMSGHDIPAEMTFYHREFEKREINRIRRSKDTLEQKIEEESDPLICSQMKRQLESVMEDMSMINMSRKDARANPEMAKKEQFNPQIAETIKLKITLPENLEPGTHELRVVTTNGLSNPIIFQIGTLREAFETAANKTLETTAKSVESLPVLFNGQIMPGEVDYFCFRAERGQTLVCQVYARALIPYLADAVPGWFQAVLGVYDASGNELAYVDDFRGDPDPVLVFDVPKDGEYILSIKDSIYRGRQDFVYRISVGELPFIDYIFPLGGQENAQVPVQVYGANLPSNTLTVDTSGDAPEIRDIAIRQGSNSSNSRRFAIDALTSVFEAEPNNIPAQAQLVTGPLVIDGRIETPDDIDCFCFDGIKGETVSAEVMARRLNSPLDAQLILLDPEEHVVAVSDDEVDRSTGLITHHADSRLSCELPMDGRYVVRLRDLQNKGGNDYTYRLRIGSEHPDFQLRMTPSSLRIPQEGSALITVHVLRQGGFDDVIELALKDPPDGLFLEKTEIPAGADKLQTLISTDKSIGQGFISIEMEGTAWTGGRRVRRRAVPAEDMMQAFLYRHLVPSQEMMAMVTESEPATVKLSLPNEGVVEVRAGSRIRLRYSVDRHNDFNGPIKLSLSEPPEWAALGLNAISGKNANYGTLTIDINENADTGMSSTLVLNGKVRISKKKTDPDYNMIAKWMNYKDYEFTIDAIPVKIID